MFSKYRIFLSIILFIYLILLAWLSLAPASTFSNSLINFPGADKIIHGIIYMFLGLLLFLFLNEVRNPSIKTNIYVFVSASGYGLLMELLQLWIRNSSRSFELADVVANCVGVVVGILSGYVVKPFLVRILNRNQD